MLKRRLLKWVLILAVMVAGYSMLSRWLKSTPQVPAGKGKVALIHITGPMMSSKKTVELLERYSEQEAIKAIVLRIDTPGGGVAVAQEIVRAMERAKSQGKKIVASLGSVAASGGYYVASAAHAIIANEGTLTGSIGVIISYPNAEELLKKIGLRFEVVKSGDYKDVGSPTRKLTKDEERILKEMIDDVYGQFVNVIIKGRSEEIQKVVAARDKIDLKAVTSEMVRDAVLKVSDGRIFSGAKAKEYGLVDGFGNITDAVEFAAARAGILGKPEVVEEHKRFSFLDYFLGEASESVANHFSLDVPPIRYQLGF